MLGERLSVTAMADMHFSKRNRLSAVPGVICETKLDEAREWARTSITIGIDPSMATDKTSIAEKTPFSRTKRAMRHASISLASF
jgi:hypothetical protein